METAFVLINVEAGRVPEVVDGLNKIPEVTEVYSIAGEYDIVAKIRFDNLKVLGELVPKRLQKIQGITHTMTLLTFEVHKYSRFEPCQQASQLEEKGESARLYALCKGCRQLADCVYGQQVMSRGIEPQVEFRR